MLVGSYLAYSRKLTSYKKTEDAQMLSIEPFKNAFVKVNVYNNSSFIQ